MKHGALWLIAALGVGALQAWDSGAFGVGAMVAVLTVTGILLPAATLVIRMHHGVRIAALAAGTGLLIWARIASPEALNTLHLSLFPSYLAILFVGGQSWAHHPDAPTT
jgi:hypothetical protein